MKHVICLLLLLTWAGPATALSIVDSKHNLATSGPGPWKSLAEDKVCVFCHTPRHRGEAFAGRWNRRESTTTYITYTSPTLQTRPDQPTGSSKLCLSCHDGTIALGEVLSDRKPIPFPASRQRLDSGPAFLGTDLSDDHPISILYPTSAELHPRSTIDLPLDGDGLVQCTTCHDPHDNQWGRFLRKPNTASALCTTCHDPTGWPTSSHAVSNATWDHIPPDPWPNSEETTVAANGCENCHSPHNGESGEFLLTYGEEDGCLVCHNGHVASGDVAADMAKPYRHPVELTAGVHLPNEDAVPASRHVECADCHNPHQGNEATTTAPNAPGALAGVRGVNLEGALVDEVTYQYELCFRCHGDRATGYAPIPRQVLQTNTRLEFDLNNPSYHPVAGPGVNPDVPSLLAPWNTGSLLYCTDCHASNDGPGAGGLGAAGPHGSIFPFLLERNYTTLDGTEESPTEYALCYKCHSRTSILNNESFAAHKKHLVDVKTPCSVCHDPHGISATQGNAINHSHLINFDLSVVFPEPASNRLEFEDLGRFTGRCTLLCHDRSHNGEQY